MKVAKLVVLLRVLATAAGMLVAVHVGPSAVAGGDPLAARFGGAFELVAHDGRSVSDRDFHGRFMLVYFGYTGCPDICPLDLSVMTQALDLLGGARCSRAAALCHCGS